MTSTHRLRSLPERAIVVETPDRMACWMAFLFGVTIGLIAAGITCVLVGRI